MDKGKIQIRRASDLACSGFEDQDVPVSQLHRDVVALLVVHTSSEAGADDAVIAFANPGFDGLHDHPVQGWGGTKVAEFVLHDSGDHTDPIFRHVAGDNFGLESGSHFGVSSQISKTKTTRSFPESNSYLNLYIFKILKIENYEAVLNFFLPLSAVT